MTEYLREAVQLIQDGRMQFWHVGMMIDDSLPRIQLIVWAQDEDQAKFIATAITECRYRHCSPIVAYITDLDPHEEYIEIRRAMSLLRPGKRNCFVVRASDITKML